MHLFEAVRTVSISSVNSGLSLDTHVIKTGGNPTCAKPRYRVSAARNTCTMSSMIGSSGRWVSRGRIVPLLSRFFSKLLPSVEYSSGVVRGVQQGCTGGVVSCDIPSFHDKGRTQDFSQRADLPMYPPPSFELASKSLPDE